MVKGWQIGAQVCGAIECLEDATANPLESLSENYQTFELSERSKAELAALSENDRASLLREWRYFLSTYLKDFKTPYPADSFLAEFWRHEEAAWVATLDRAELKLSSFGPAFKELLALSDS